LPVTGGKLYSFVKEGSFLFKELYTAIMHYYAINKLNEIKMWF